MRRKRSQQKLKTRIKRHITAAKAAAKKPAAPAPAKKKAAAPAAPKEPATPKE